MKVVLTRKFKQASALVTTLVICSILSMFVMYYLSLIDQQSYLSARSQVWNMAIAVSEAGVEDGLQQLNTAFPDMNTDGWSYDGVSTYTRSNTLPDGSSYVAYIVVTNWFYPVVSSRAYVSSLPRYGMASGPFFAAAGNSQVTVPSTVTRAVQVTTQKHSLFLVAMVAKKNIDLNGNNVVVDSFDSSDPTKSVNGQYTPSFYAGDKGDVATDLGVIDSIAGGNANIYGHAHTGPGSPNNAVQIGPQGAIGSHAWQAGGGSGIESGYWTADSNFTIPDNSMPNTASFLTPTNGTVIISSNYLSNGSATTINYPNLPPGVGASTNVVSTATSTTYPTPPPASVTTNVSTSTVSSYPSSPVPAGLTTNTTWVNNSTTLPNPVPGGTTTNTTSVTSVSLPSPVPAGTTTNTISVTSLTYPPAGTYLGSVTTTVVTSGPQSGRGTWYTFNQINGYTYPSLTYNYPTYTYSYPTYTYTYPSSFSYTPYVTNTVYVTNSYNQILWGTSAASATNYYVASSLSGQTLVLGENVVLALPNGLSESGNDSIMLAGSGTVMGFSGSTFGPLSLPQANITVYAGGTSCTIVGNGVVNQPGYANDFILYCMPSVTTFSFSGNGAFSGVIDAPEADVTMNGGGNGKNVDYVGALIANSVTMNGHFGFHYDESLSGGNKNGRFLIMSWNEIK